MIAHWDEVDEHRRHAGHIQGVWQDLGRAAGSLTVGVKRIRVPPGGWSTPAHIHGRDEEIFYVLAGSGLSWQGAKTFEIGAGDAIVHLANGEPHTVYGGDEGIDVLAFGMRERDEAAFLPRAGVLWLGSHYVDAGDPERTPWRREEGAGPPELPPPGARPPSIVNVAELTGSVDRPPGYAARWRDLGRKAGSVQTGIRHVTIEPGNLSAPPHVHSAEEEIFVVLEGEGTLVLIPGDEGIDVLAFGMRERDEAAYLPRAGVLWLGSHYVEAADPERTPWRREEGAGPPELPPPSERPPSIVNVAELTGNVDRPPGYAARWRDLGRKAGSVQTGIRHVTIEPGNLSAPPHVHSAEEEIFVVLEGEGTLVLIPGDEVPVRAGHVVSRPPGSRVAHAFRAGEAALTLLAYGTRDPNDVAFYPRSNKVYFRGVGLIARVEPLDYWDGE